MKRTVKKIVVSTLCIGLNLTLLTAEESTQGDSTRGATLWSDVCIQCHNVREPSALSKRAWKFSMQHMRVRAGLTGQETRDILAFILDAKTAEDDK